MDLGKYLKEKKRLDPERAVSYALDIARYILYPKSYMVFSCFRYLKLKSDL
jgi:hypothetical protein